jgi:hypothetical protein
LFALLLWTHAASAAEVDVRSNSDVTLAMARVEALLRQVGIDVIGYAASAPPAVERSPANHPYLQGNDGGYVPGRIYISEDAIEACLDLTLIHELVHDASMKFRLFSAAPNDRIRDLFEALADAVTSAAAEDPYRPGCLPNRRFEVSSLDLPVLARAAAAP